jgi:hypothetical protein
MGHDVMNVGMIKWDFLQGGDDFFYEEVRVKDFNFI